MKNKICGIYKITSPSGKIYIGQTINTEKRQNDYRTLRSKNQTKIFYSIKKYGWDAHLFEVIQECLPEQLNELEIYYIKLFNTYNTTHGLNLQSGGSANFEMSEETKAKMSIANKGRKGYWTGKKLSETHKKNVGLAGIGRKKSVETRQKLSNSIRNSEKYYAVMKSSEHRDKMKVLNKGRTSPMKGKKLSIERCKEISKRLIDSKKWAGENNPKAGTKGLWNMDQETKNKIKEATTGDKNHFFGKKHTEETKIKMKSAIRQPIGDEQRKKMSEASKGRPNILKGKNMPPETVAKMKATRLANRLKRKNAA